MSVENNDNVGKINFCVVMLVAMLLPLLSPAQNLKIVGKTNKSNALVRLLAYDDLFTKEQTVIAETYSDFGGSFSFNTVIQQDTPAQIAVNLDRVDVVLRPGSFYDLEIFVPERKNDVSYFDKELPTLKINSARDNDMSMQLIAAESFINDFVYENINGITRGRKSYLLDTLEVRVNNLLGDKENAYVVGFVRYKLAALRLVASPGSFSKIITQYFDNQPVLYLQTSYNELFNELFSDFFSSREFNRRELWGALYSGYDGFWNYIKKSDFLSRNPRLAELIVMRFLNQLYYESPEMRWVAFDFINIIKNESEYPENKAVASNLMKKIRRLSYDSEAAGFSLADKNGDTVKLSDYQDGMVLLQFVDKVSKMTDYEFSRLNELQKQWNDTISVITIATKESFDKFVKLFDNQKYNWKLLNLGDDILLFEEYEVMACPNYVILKSGGRVGMTPAPSPDQYLDYHVRRIYGYK